MRAHCSAPSLPPLSDRTVCATPRPQRTALARMLIALLAAAAPMALQAAPKLNELQYIGSHNSYHAGFAPSEATLLQRIDPSMFATLNYRHPPLTQQLDDGVRQLELDIYADAKGGRYAHPALIQQIAKAGLPPAPAFAPPGVMERPGFKVLHIQDIDQRSTCQPLVACLREVRAWSKQHPGHVPIFILLETKESPMHLAFPTVQPEPFDTAALDALDRELRSVFKPGEYLSPDQVRGKAPRSMPPSWPTAGRRWMMRAARSYSCSTRAASDTIIWPAIRRCAAGCVSPMRSPARPMPPLSSATTAVPKRSHAWSKPAIWSAPGPMRT